VINRDLFKLRIEYFAKVKKQADEQHLYPCTHWLHPGCPFKYTKQPEHVRGEEEKKERQDW